MFATIAITLQAGASLSRSPEVAGQSATLTAVIVLPDDGKSTFLDEIDAASDSIRLYLYLLSDDDVIRQTGAPLSR